MLVKLYVARPDILSNEQLFAIDAIELTILGLFSGFTKYPGMDGLWIDTDGIKYKDVVDIYEVMVNTGIAKDSIVDTFTNLAKKFANILGQKCIPLTVLESENHFVEVND